VGLGKRRRAVPAICLLAAGLALLGYLLLRHGSSPEPRFNHQPISYYVARVNSAAGTNSYDQYLASQAAAAALRQMGPPAVDWLARHLERRDTRWAKFYRALWQAAPIPLRRHLSRPAQAPGPKSPDLLDHQVLEALIRTGAGATPVLTNYLNASVYELDTRHHIYYAVIAYGDIFTNAIPALEHSLALPNPYDRIYAAYAIARADPTRTDEMVTLIVTALNSGTEPNLAADILGDMGKAARAAIPQLDAAMNNSDPKLRERARVALQKITGKPIPRK
jgi:hypothetical protein